MICWIFKCPHGKLLCSFLNPHFLIQPRKKTLSCKYKDKSITPFDYFSFLSGGSLDLWSSWSRCHHLWNQANSNYKTLSMRSSIIEKPPSIRSDKVSYLDVPTGSPNTLSSSRREATAVTLWTAEKDLIALKTADNDFDWLENTRIINKVIASFGLRKG